MTLNTKNFIKNLKNNYTFETKPFFAVAVSGGPDSMCLIFLLNYVRKIYNCNLIALIVNHNLRDNSKSEALKVKCFLKKYRIKSKVLEVNKIRVSKKTMNEARSNRYNLLTKYCQSKKILHLFVAHHNDDNLETFLYRKVSGSDFEGLQSMQKISLINKTNILRPLLQYSKHEIIKFNNDNNIPYVQDPSNLNFRYTRPIIRNFIEETSSKNIKDLKNDYSVIRSNTKLYNKMIYEILIKNIFFINSNIVKINMINFNNLDNLISEKLVKKIYQFLYGEIRFLRSKKIQLLIDYTKSNDFNIFNLKGMIIKKDNDSLIFSK